jgi:hypothetical protein
MKRSTSKFGWRLGLLFCSVFIRSCLGTKEKEVEVIKTQQPAFEKASATYSVIVEESLNVMQDFDFDGLSKYFDDDVEWYGPNVWYGITFYYQRKATCN